MAHGRVRPRRALPDARVRDERPRPRHEQLDVRRRSSIPTSRSTAARCSTPETLQEARREWGRYKDVDGDGIPYRTLPGDGMPSYFTRGSGHNAKRAVQRAARRLRRQHRSARAQVRDGAEATCRSRSSTRRRTRRSASSATAPVALGDRREPRSAARGDRASRRRTSACARIRSPTESGAFIDAHERVYVVEQNRDAQMLQLMKLELHAGARRRKLRSVLHYNGLPIDARSRSPTTCWRRKASKCAKKTVPRASSARHGRWTNRSMATPSKRIASASNRSIYKGGKTTLCAGCGHNAISERIIDAFYEMGVDPKRGASSCRASAARARARRISSAARTASTPCTAACRRSAPARCSPTSKLIAIGISGDGDTGAIGIGQFVHLMRRNLPIIYIIEDNGCYGLTKGQFSPTADLGSKLKNGVVNDLPPIDTCALAIELGATFVGALVLGRQEAAALAPQGGARAPRHRDDRRHLAVRHLQRSRGLDQELRLREGSRRAARATSASCRSSRTSPSTTTPGTTHGGDDARRVEAVSEEARRGLQPDRQDRGAAAAARDRARAASSRPASSTSSRTRTTSSRSSTSSTSRSRRCRSSACGPAPKRSTRSWKDCDKQGKGRRQKAKES